MVKLLWETTTGDLSTDRADDRIKNDAALQDEARIAAAAATTALHKRAPSPATLPSTVFHSGEDSRSPGLDFNPLHQGVCQQMRGHEYLDGDGASTMCCRWNHACFV